MKTIITWVLLSSSILFASSSCDNSIDEIKDKDRPNSELPKPIMIDLQGVESSMVKSDQRFAFDFFEHLFHEERNDEDKNFMASPFSLKMALAMTWNGSAGDTKLSIQNTLGLGDWTDDEVNSYFKKLKDAFEKTDPSTQLVIANSIWTNRNVEILPNFISLNKTYYNATVEAVDFGSLATVDRINKWAAENTKGLIGKVIETISEDDLMYLLNALYFKGTWTTEFDAEKTSKMNFTTNDGSKTKVDMMYQEALFGYAEDQTMQLIELPYGNEAFSMMVLLPKDGKMLTDVTQALQQADYWNNLKRDMNNKKVDLFIPKFKTEYSKKLNNVLKDMGMSVAFTAGKADFSRMSDREAFISFVSQDTYIATDEVGTEAAAVTSVGITTTSFPPSSEKVIFKAVKPFIYLIQEKSTGSILFMGTVKKF